MADRAAVSVLLPTYNRARFLPAAFESIRGQTFDNWELVIVDDGSTDDTRQLVEQFERQVPQQVLYVKQPNAGAYAARNTALDRASAPLIAFYDSDDVWLPHHLQSCVEALEAAPDVGGVYAACRVVHYDSGSTIDPSTFRIRGQPRPFLALRVRQVGPLRVFDDDRVVEWALRYGLYCGLQNSVIRASVFKHEPFRTTYRNEAEDQLFVIRALKRGHKLGYLDSIHVQYHVHGTNSSGSATGQTSARQLTVYHPMVQGYEDLQDEFTWTPRERAALSRKLGNDHFWRIGYAILWAGGRRAEALESFRRGLQFWPWNIAGWKTYLIARLRFWIAGP